jgi:hypothetical protein
MRMTPYVLRSGLTLGQWSVMRHPPLLVLEAEVIAALSAAVTALDLTLESLAYCDSRTAPTASQLGIGTPCALELHQQIASALGEASADEMPRLSALLAVISAVERVTSHCAAIADLVPQLAPALRDDDAGRRTVELAAVEARGQLVQARDALRAAGVTPDRRVTPSSALPLLLDHLDHLGDEADEIGERAAMGMSPGVAVAAASGSAVAPLTASASAS